MGSHCTKQNVNWMENSNSVDDKICWTRLPDLHQISIFPYISKENKQNVNIIYLTMPIVNSDTV